MNNITQGYTIFYPLDTGIHFTSRSDPKHSPKTFKNDPDYQYSAGYSLTPQVPKNQELMRLPRTEAHLVPLTSQQP